MNLESKRPDNHTANLLRYAIISGKLPVGQFVCRRVRSSKANLTSRNKHANIYTSDKPIKLKIGQENKKFNEKRSCALTRVHAETPTRSSEWHISFSSETMHHFAGSSLSISKIELAHCVFSRVVASKRWWSRIFCVLHWTLLCWLQIESFFTTYFNFSPQVSRRICSKTSSWMCTSCALLLLRLHLICNSQRTSLNDERRFANLFCVWCHHFGVLVCGVWCLHVRGLLCLRVSVCFDGTFVVIFGAGLCKAWRFRISVVSTRAGKTSRADRTSPRPLQPAREAVESVLRHMQEHGVWSLRDWSTQGTQNHHHQQSGWYTVCLFVVVLIRAFRISGNRSLALSRFQFTLLLV